ncbi:MAG: macrolide family glycosyltransferase [Pseudomonadota bacterium]
MGKAVFFNLPGATGHINPALGVVSELISHGEEVIFYADAASASKLAALGATARDYCRWSDYDHDPATAADLMAVGIALFEMTEQCLPGLLRELEADRPDYIIYDSCAPWGPLLADRLGIPAIKFVTHVLWTNRMTFDPRHWLNLDMLSLVIRSYRLESHIRGIKLAANARQRFRNMVSRIGGHTRRPLRDAIGLLRRPDEPNICVTSPRYQPHAEKMNGNTHFVGASIPEGRDGQNFQRPGLHHQCLIYISLGSVHNQKLDFYRDCLVAFADAPYQVVMSVGRHTRIGDLGTIPQNVHVYPWVPQLEVIRQAQLFISHGGMNSINESLYFNVPLLMVPQQAEQAFSARRIQKLGAGLCLRPSRVSPQRLCRMAEQILSEPSYRDNAAILGTSVRAGGHQRAAQLMLDHISRIQQAKTRETTASSREPVPAFGTT